MANLILLVGWGLCGYACYAIAKSKNRNHALWAVLGFLFGLIAVIIIAVLPNLPV
ncbi:hypothetical protein [Baaleninema sp.]|uniref:hypothetical protein n=1 Tax=Baaleninema sp. TaxID=3101197 RepID=UPI003CFE6C70